MIKIKKESHFFSDRFKLVKKKLSQKTKVLFNAIFHRKNTKLSIILN
jgi:hypothetical protein